MRETTWCNPPANVPCPGLSNSCRAAGWITGCTAFSAASGSTASGGDLEAEVNAGIDLATVQRSIAALPDEQREALLLVCVEGVGYRRAAEILNLPLGTVTSRVFRARVAIGKALEDPRAGGAQII